MNESLINEIKNLCLQYKRFNEDNKTELFYEKYGSAKIYYKFKLLENLYSSNALLEYGKKNNIEEYKIANYCFYEILNHFNKDILPSYIKGFRGLVGNKNGVYKHTETTKAIKIEDSQLKQILNISKANRIYARKFNNILDYFRHFKDYDHISCGINSLERECIIIDCDNVDENNNILFHSVEEVKEYIKYIEKEIFPVSFYRIKTDSYHFQVGWILEEPINLIIERGFYFREKSALQKCYNIITKEFNKSFNGDKCFSGFVIQNPYCEADNVKNYVTDNKYKFSDIIDKYNSLAREGKLFDNYILPIPSMYSQVENPISKIYSIIMNPNNISDSQENFDIFRKASIFYSKNKNKVSFDSFNVINSYVSETNYYKNFLEINHIDMSVKIDKSEIDEKVTIKGVSSKESRQLTLCSWIYKEFMIKTRELTIKGGYSENNKNIIYPSLNELIRKAQTVYYPQICEKLHKYTDKATANEIAASVIDTYNKAKSKFIMSGYSKKSIQEEYENIIKNLPEIYKQGNTRVSEKAASLLAKSNSEILYTDEQRKNAQMIKYIGKLKKILSVRDLTSAGFSISEIVNMKKKNYEKGFSSSNVAKLLKEPITYEDKNKVETYYSFVSDGLKRCEVKNKKIVEAKNDLEFIQEKLNIIYPIEFSEVIKGEELQFYEDSQFVEIDKKANKEYFDKINKDISIKESFKKDDYYMACFIDFIKKYSVMSQFIRGKLLGLKIHPEYFNPNNSKVFN